MRQTGLDVELGADGGLQPLGHAHGIGDQQAHDERPEGPLQIAVQGEFGADEAHEDGQDEQDEESGNVFLDLTALQFDTEGEQDAQHQEGAEELHPESAVELRQEGFLFGDVLPQMPGGELGGREVEGAGEHRDARDGDDGEADPDGQPVFLFPKVGDV